MGAGLSPLALSAADHGALGLIVLFFVFLAVIVARVGRRPYTPALQTEFMRQKREASLRESWYRRLIDPIVTTVAAMAGGLGISGHLEWLRRNLAYAAYPHGYSPEEFVGAGVANSLASLLMAAVGLAILTDANVAWALIAAIVTYPIQCSNLSAAVAKRRFLTNIDLPYFMDLVTLSMEAGSTFQNACRTIADGPIQGPVEENVAIMLMETRAGATYVDALQNMLTRSDSEDLAVMVAAVRQGHELGTPLASTLRRQSELSRFRRTKRGLQLSAKLPNRLAVPTVFLMFACMLLLIGPVVLKVLREGILQ